MQRWRGQSSGLSGVVDIICDKSMLVTAGTARALDIYGIRRPLERTEARLERVTPRAMIGKGRSHLKLIFWICSFFHIGLGVEVSVILTQFQDTCLPFSSTPNIRSLGQGDAPTRRLFRHQE